MPDGLRPRTIAEMPAQKAPQPSTAAEARGRFFNTGNGFNVVNPPVPDHLFVEEPRRALDPSTPTGLIACDISDEYTSIGKPFWREAGVADRIELRIGPAIDTLHQLLGEERAGTFDFAFIDADKSHYEEYFEACLQLVRSGGLILIDNVLWGGSVADPAKSDADTDAIRALNAALHQDRRIDLSLIPIGDGLTVARKR